MRYNKSISLDDKVWLAVDDFQKKNDIMKLSQAVEKVLKIGFDCIKKMEKK